MKFFKHLLKGLGILSPEDKARNRIEEMIRIGRDLMSHLKRLKGKDLGTVPTNELISNAEWEAWRSNTISLVESICGAKSRNTKKIKELWDMDPPASYPVSTDPLDRYISRIVQINGFLNQLKGFPDISRNAVEKIRDQLARHPVLGWVISLLFILAAVFSVIRGVEFVLNLLQRTQ